jgi:thiamine-monophosphate kinase
MEFENTSRTELSELGEFGLIKHLTQHVQLHQQSTIKGVGDDAAVIEYDNKQTVITTDMLVEGVHFDLTYVPLKHLGYKSVMVNLSDLLAMNAKPQQILVSIAISNRFSLEAIEELYAGMLLACNKHAIDLIGGDTTSSRSGLVISITAIGSAEKNKIVYRNKAKENDLLCISGDLGGAYMGLQILEREKAVFKENPNLQPDLTGKDYILERQLKPEARFDVIDLFEKINLQPTAMIDVSDGLSSEILHIVTQSEVGVDLYEEKIPIDTETYETAREFNLDPTMCALNGGEDYELLFTISMGDYEKIKNKNLVSVI